MVLDFRALDDKTISGAYRLPNITEIFDQVGGAKYYTELDLASGFLQIKMGQQDAHKTALVHHLDNMSSLECYLD